MTKVGILDYGMGNLKSVYNALKSIEANPFIILNNNHFDECTHLVIPGVGSYEKAIQNIRSREYEKSIIDFKNKKKPILGICLGMQLLSSYGYEPVKTEGMGIIAGEVKKFRNPPVRIIPHMGWNSLELLQENYLFEGIKKNADFYFIHSYYFVPQSKLNILALTNYYEVFCSVVFNENVYGVQFHPEKSQKHGLRLLKNFTFNSPC